MILDGPENAIMTKDGLLNNIKLHCEKVTLVSILLSLLSTSKRKSQLGAMMSLILPSRNLNSLVLFFFFHFIYSFTYFLYLFTITILVFSLKIN